MVQPKITGIQHGIPRMLYANDGSNWYAVLVDSDGHVKVDVVAYPGSNAFGNVPFGYYDRYWLHTYTANATAGTNFQDSGVVPAGEVWVITSVRGVNDNTGTIILEFHLVSATEEVVLYRKFSPGALIDVLWAGSVCLKAGDYVRVIFYGCTLNDDITSDIIGYKMKVA